MTYKPEIIDKIGLDIMRARDIANEYGASIDIGVTNNLVYATVKKASDSEETKGLWNIKDLYFTYEREIDEISFWMKLVCKGEIV